MNVGQDWITLDVGESLDSFSPDYPIHAIMVDNKTGEWLYVSNIDQYIPPYTLGWKRNLHQSTQSLTVRIVVPGPTGMDSKLTGDGITIWTLADEQAVESDGVQYITQKQPHLYQVASTVFGLAAGITNSVAITPSIASYGTTRFRIFGCLLRGVGATMPLAFVTGRFSANISFAFLSISPNKQMDTFWFPNPIDLNINEGVIIAVTNSRGPNSDVFGQIIYAGI